MALLFFNFNLFLAHCCIFKYGSNSSIVFMLIFPPHKGCTLHLSFSLSPHSASYPYAAIQNFSSSHRICIWLISGDWLRYSIMCIFFSCSFVALAVCFGSVLLYDPSMTHFQCSGRRNKAPVQVFMVCGCALWPFDVLCFYLHGWLWQWCSDISPFSWLCSHHEAAPARGHFIFYPFPDNHT